MYDQHKLELNKWQLFMCGAAGLYLSFTAGLECQRHHYNSMVFSLLLTVFLAGIYVIALRENTDLIRRELSDQAKGRLDETFAEATEASKKTIADLDGISNNVNPEATLPDHDELLMEKFTEIVHRVVGMKVPTTEQIESIKQIFTEETDHHVTVAIDDDGIRMRFSHVAFPPAPPKDPKHAVKPRKSHKVAKDIPVKRKRVAPSATKKTVKVKSKATKKK